MLPTCVSTHQVCSGVYGDHKRASYALALKLQMVCKFICGGWKLNPGSLVEHPVNLNVEPSVCPVQF